MVIGIDVRLWNQTGVGRYIRNLVQNLALIDKKNKYILFARDDDKVKINSSNFKTVSANIAWHSFDEQFKFIDILAKEKLDLIHFPYYSVPIFYRKPYVVTIHDLIPLHFQTGKASTLPFPLYKIKFLGYKFIVSQAAKSAKKIIAPSNFSKEEIIRLLNVPVSKVQTIYEGIDKSLVSEKISARKKEHFLYVGNAYPHKNMEFLLKVFSKLPDEKLVLVGKKDYFYRKLEDRVRKSNFSNIKFFGYATDSQLLQIYRKAKALIIPSFIEGFGLPALEAMSNKCLVLASDILVNHEILRDAAVYFNPNDMESLNDILVQANNKLFENKIELGLKRAKEFSWEKAAKETLHLYESCVQL